MTPKEKAKELFNKMDNVVGGGNYDAKQYALIAVDEILLNIEATIIYHKNSNALPINKEYWQEVKEEINKL